MLQLQKRDREVFRFLEEYRAITTQQATNIFFDGLNKSAIRRLNQFEEAMILTHYVRGKNKVYKLIDEKKECSEHDILILDFYSWIYKQGGDVIEFIKNPHYFKNMLIPDALVKFRIPYHGQSYIVCALLEIDLNHYTDNAKMNTWYEKLYREQVLKDWSGSAQFPFIVLARPTPGIRYNSKNFNCIYTNLKFINLLQFMLD